VTEGVEDPAKAPAVLVAHGGRGRGPGRDRPCKDRVGLVDQQQDPAGRPADRLRAEPRPVRAARGNPEERVADCQLGDDLIAFADLMQDPRTESRLVKRDRRGRATDPQLRLDARHADQRSRRRHVRIEQRGAAGCPQDRVVGALPEALDRLGVAVRDGRLHPVARLDLGQAHDLIDQRGPVPGPHMLALRVHRGADSAVRTLGGRYLRHRRGTAVVVRDLDATGVLRVGHGFS
jgi:hypothetical protein